MHRILHALPVVLLAAAVAEGQALGAAPTTVGNAATVVRTVTGTLEADIRSISLLDDLYHNELIETAEESAAELVFLDETKLSMGPDSSLVLDKFVYDPDPGQASFIVTATKGVFRFATGNLPKKSYTIHTPTATIGIRGTEFDLVVTPPEQGEETSSVVVRMKEGEAIISDCDGGRVVLDTVSSSAEVVREDDGSCVVKGSGPPELVEVPR